MGGATGLAPEQLVALGRIANVPEAASMYLAGDSAVAYHFGHRRSEDVDLFSATSDLDLGSLRRALLSRFPAMTIRESSDVMLKVVAEGVAIDFVRYPYSPLVSPAPGPAGVAYFASAESDPLYPAGLTPRRWDEIKAYFEAEAPKLLR